MATPPKPFTFVEDTDIIADEVNADFDALYDWVSGSAIHSDASKAFTAIPSGPNQNPTSDNQLARKKYVDQQIDNSGKVIGYIESTWADTFGPGQAAVPNTSMTRTFVNGRLYRFTGECLLEITGEGYILTVFEGGTVRGRLDQKNEANSLGEFAHGTWSSSSLSGVRTFSLGISTVNGAGALKGNVQPHQFTIEDLGPVPT